MRLLISKVYINLRSGHARLNPPGVEDQQEGLGEVVDQSFFNFFKVKEVTYQALLHAWQDAHWVLGKIGDSLA